MPVLDHETRAQLKAEAGLILSACEVIIEAAEDGDVEFLVEMGRERLIDHTAALLSTLRRGKREMAE